MKKAYVIGIAGESAGGKSTITDKLEEMLKEYKVKLIHFDDYYKPESERPTLLGVTDGKKYVDDNHPQALDFDQIHIDFDKAASEDWDIIIVDGSFVLWDSEIIPSLNLKLFVDCDSDERMTRRIKRHLEFGQNFQEITDRYVQAVQPRQKEYVEQTKWKANLILNGFLNSALELDIIVSWVQKEVGERQ